MLFTVFADVFCQTGFNVAHHGLRIEFIDRDPRDAGSDSGGASVARNALNFVGLDRQGGFLFLEFGCLGIKGFTEAGILEQGVKLAGIF